MLRSSAALECQVVSANTLDSPGSFRKIASSTPKTLLGAISFSHAYFSRHARKRKKIYKGRGSIFLQDTQPKTSGPSSLSGVFLSGYRPAPSVTPSEDPRARLPHPQAKAQQRWGRCAGAGDPAQLPGHVPAQGPPKKNNG
eukprot:1162023-Pelagomonas_calceolata.AAC.6